MGSVAVSAIVFYLLTVVVVRISGKRTTGQMNNFDWIITVAVGSLISAGVLLREVSIADAALAVVMLLAMQWGMTWLALRSERFSILIKSTPRLLVHKGEPIMKALRQERMTMGELRSRLRQEGYVSMAEANWVILKNSGKMTVIPRQEAQLGDAPLLKDVEYADAELTSVGR